MRMLKNQAGFSAIELVIGLAIVAAIGFVGYKAVTNAQLANQTSAGTSAAAETTAPAPQIKSAADLKAADSALNELDANASASDAASLSLD